MKVRSFQGIWIPKDLWFTKELSIMEKLFLIEINSLDNEDGCWASNSYFADFFDLSKSRCSEIIKSLIDKKMILANYEIQKSGVKKRYLKVVSGVFGKPNEGIRKAEEGYSENRQRYSEKAIYNNTIINTRERGETPLAFLQKNSPSVYESLLMKYRSQIQDFNHAIEQANLKIESEDLEWTTKKIYARFQYFLNNWKRNENKFSQPTESQTKNYKQVRF